MKRRPGNPVDGSLFSSFSQQVQPHWQGTALCMVLLVGMNGCSSTAPLRLPSHFESESRASEVIQEKLAAHSQNRLPAAMAIILIADSPQGTPVLSDDHWPKFAARVKQQVQGFFPDSMQEVVRLEEIPSGEGLNHLKELGERDQLEVVLFVLPTSSEVKAPAQFYLAPEVSMVNGQEIENHASVELGLLDLKSGKLLIHSQGSSSATLQQLDVPLASNRYPRIVKESSRNSAIRPEESRALETLRMVALQEALNQAVVNFQKAWPKAIGPTASGE